MQSNENPWEQSRVMLEEEQEQEEEMIHKEVTSEGEFIAGEAFCHILHGRTIQRPANRGVGGGTKLGTKAEVLCLFVLLILFIFIEVKLAYHVVLRLWCTAN